MTIAVSPIRLRVRELREAKGWTQQQLADAAGVRRATLSAIERNETTGIDFAVLEGLARALGVAPAYLIQGDDEPPPAKRKGRG